MIVRTDRIGDVVLTTPALKALRVAYPEAKISILLAPVTRDIIDGNACVDQILVDDRAGEHRGLLGFMKLIHQVRKNKFDCALILHTKKRTNLLCFLAGIPERIGYKNEKLGCLLNRPLDDTRHKGERHEAQYCLDVLKALSIDCDDLELYLPVKEDALLWVERMKQKHLINNEDRLVAIHAGSSDPSRRWPEYRFAQLIKELIQRYHARIVMIGSPDVCVVTQKIISSVNEELIDLTGQTSVSQLAALLTCCDLLISNDSGPVHMASAVGTPVVSIFTRNQPGINPQRWGPLGPRSRVVSVQPSQSNGKSFKKARPFDTQYMELIDTDEVLEAVDALFKLC